MMRTDLFLYRYCDKKLISNSIISLNIPYPYAAVRQMVIDIIFLGINNSAFTRLQIEFLQQMPISGKNLLALRCSDKIFM